MEPLAPRDFVPHVMVFSTSSPIREKVRKKIVDSLPCWGAGITSSNDAYSFRALYIEYVYTLLVGKTADCV